MKKGFLIAAIILTALGAAIFTGALFATGFDFSRLSGGKEMEEKIYTVSENFQDVEIRTDVTDIEFKVSQDGSFKAVAKEPAKMHHTVEVVNGTLKIESVDERKWYDCIGFFWKAPTMTIYLPAKEGNRGSLRINNGTGDLEIPAGFEFYKVEIESSTGDVDFTGKAAELLKIRTSTGDITVERFLAGKLELGVSTGKVTVRSGRVESTSLSPEEEHTGRVTLTVSTGAAVIEDLNCGSFYSNGNTGDIRLKNVVTRTDMNIERSTGDIRFESCDALKGTITLKTSTGDVRGSLKTGKLFSARSSTGSVQVPESTGDCRCEVSTSTGSIRINIE